MASTCCCLAKARSVFDPDTQTARIRAIFGLADKSPLPRVDRHTLRRYYEHLSANLSVPFDALYADTVPPVRQLVRYIRVVGLKELLEHPGAGLMCEVRDGLHPRELPLAEIGVREDNSNFELLDDYAYWFLNQH